MKAQATREAPLAGTRPEGTRNEQEAAARVREMFARIAPRYDFLNHLLSFSLDRLWRRQTAKEFRHILERPDARVLDLCCGTGDLAFALDAERRGAQPQGGPAPISIVGGDFVEAMLQRARQKAVAGDYAAIFVASDALRLPFADSSFDLVTSAFGFRNLANYERGLKEIARVLKRGGEVGILDFSEPEGGAAASVFRFYFRNILPRVGGAISGSREAYAYLPRSVAKFLSSDGLKSMLEASGFESARVRNLSFGSIVLHRARRT